MPDLTVRALIAVAGAAAAVLALPAAPAVAVCETFSALNRDGMWAQACADPESGVRVTCGREELGCEE